MPAEDTPKRNPSKPVVEIQGLSIVRGRGPDAFSMQIDSLELEPGQHAACIGPSGCGKTTLLRMISGVLAPSRGTVWVAGTTITSLSDNDKRAFRATTIGMVFQHFALIDYLSAMDNILLPFRVCPALTLDKAARDRARTLADQAGIAKLLARRPDRLSQGERQRVAICRALVTKPTLLLCDEPTGNLDPERSREAIDLILREADAAGATALVVTHDHSLLGGFARVIEMQKLIQPVSQVSEDTGASA